jgi:hypothetical protein
LKSSLHDAGSILIFILSQFIDSIFFSIKNCSYIHWYIYFLNYFIKDTDYLFYFSWWCKVCCHWLVRSLLKMRRKGLFCKSFVMGPFQQSRPRLVHREIDCLVEFWGVRGDNMAIKYTGKSFQVKRSAAQESYSGKGATKR